MRIGVASDHAGFRYKTLVAQHLRSLGHEVQDFGAESEDPVDYPTWSARSQPPRMSSLWGSVMCQRTKCWLSLISG